MLRRVVFFVSALALVLASIPLAPTSVAGQTTKPWTPLRTPDGRSDLQGIWDFRTATPTHAVAGTATRW